MANETDSQEQLNLETETPAAETTAAEPEKPRQDFVPHQALHEQREITKQLRAQLAEANARTERMEGTFQKLLSGLNEKPVPAFDQDPLGHFQAREAELERQLTGVNEKLEKLGKDEQTQAQIHRLTTATVAAEAEFRAAHPDYDAAVKHLKDISRQDLRDQGYGPAEVEDMLNQGKLAIAHGALSQGKDPAEALYERAKRYGFKGKGNGG